MQIKVLGAVPSLAKFKHETRRAAGDVIFNNKGEKAAKEDEKQRKTNVKLLNYSKSIFAKLSWRGETS